MSKALLKQSLAIVEKGMSSFKKPEEKDIPKSLPKGKIDKRNRHLKNRPLKEPVKKKITPADIRKEEESKGKLAEENLRKLLLLSKPSAKIRNAKNIIKRAHEGRYIIEKKKKVEQESLFTEEDFAAFERELAKTIV